MEPHLLELEITESMLIRDVENTRKILTGLKTLGVRIEDTFLVREDGVESLCEGGYGLSVTSS